MPWGLRETLISPDKLMHVSDSMHSHGLGCYIGHVTYARFVREPPELGPEKKRDCRGCKSSKLVDKAVCVCVGGAWGGEAAQLTL